MVTDSNAMMNDFKDKDSHLTDMIKMHTKTVILR